MLIAGVVAEYNPFHNGHKYQLEQTRKNGATHIVSVMSGASVQRGDIAVFDKYERANAAINNGADLVIELPTPISCSNGEFFAKSAVQLLAGLGENVVNAISFGCETDDIDILNKAAKISEKLTNNEKVKELFSCGMTYPQAVSQAALSSYGEIISNVLSTPNNTLAVEYIKAVNKNAQWIKPMPIKRFGSQHDSEIVDKNISSATNIRKMILENKNITEYVPYSYSDKSYFIDNFDKGVLLKLMTASYDDVMSLPDVNENIANRFFDTVYSSPISAKAFLEKMKSKNITLARLRRLVIHLVLGVKKNDILNVPYGRILALNDRGREILSVAKDRFIMYDTSLSKLEKSSAFAKRVSFLEQNAVRFQELCTNGISEFSNEYKRKITINK